MAALQINCTEPVSRGSCTEFYYHLIGCHTRLGNKKQFVRLSINYHVCKTVHFSTRQGIKTNILFLLLPPIPPATLLSPPQLAQFLLKHLSAVSQVSLPWLRNAICWVGGKRNEHQKMKFYLFLDWFSPSTAVLLPPTHPTMGKADDSSSFFSLYDTSCGKPATLRWKGETNRYLILALKRYDAGSLCVCLGEDYAQIWCHQNFVNSRDMSVFPIWCIDQ